MALFLIITGAALCAIALLVVAPLAYAYNWAFIGRLSALYWGLLGTGGLLLMLAAFMEQ